MSGIRDWPFISNSDLYDKTLFSLLKDYWINFHHPHRCYFSSLKSYMPKVEKYIRKKWVKLLSKRKLVMRKIQE